jgi:hypothetical protein
MGEGKDIGFGRAVHTVECLRRDPDNGCNVDYRACATFDESRCRGIGQRVSAVMLRSILSSIFSMLASSSGAMEAKPALLTSMVMLGSSFSLVSTFARSGLSLRSATIGVTWSAVALARLASERFEWRLAARYQNEVVSTLGETVGVHSADASRSARYQGGAF